MKKLGFGFMRLPLIGEDQGNIDHELVNRMVDAYLERGFDYFDTAYMYHNGLSQDALRRAVVERYPRERFRLATKMPVVYVKSAEDFPRFFEEQLQRCAVDYFDSYLLHNLNVDTYAIAQKFGAFDFVQQMKAQGKIRRAGFSFHDSAALLDEILAAHPEMEFVQLQINYVDWESASIQSRACYEVARKHNKPILVMEPVKGGLLANVPPQVHGLFQQSRPDLSDASWAIRFAASLPGVELVLSGMSAMDQLLDNLSYMEHFQPLDEADMALVARAGDIIRSNTAIPCTACQYCVADCPMGIPIPRYFAMYNEGTRDGFFMLQRLYYHNMTQNGAVAPASACIACGICEGHCPQHIAIREKLQLVVEALEKR